MRQWRVLECHQQQQCDDKQMRRRAHGEPIDFAVDVALPQPVRLAQRKSLALAEHEPVIVPFDIAVGRTVPNLRTS